MAKLVVMILALLSMGCSYPFGLNIKGYTIQSGNLEHSWKEVAGMIYHRDILFDYWKSPSEFFNDKGGDCEDFSIALVYLLGRDSSLVIIRMDSGRLHGIVKYQGSFIEPQYYGFYYSREYIRTHIDSEYSYDEIMASVTLMGMKAIK